MDDPRRRGAGLPRPGRRPLGACLGAGRHDPHPVRVRGPGVVPVVLPVAGHRPRPRAEPLLLDGAVPPRRHQPAGADVGHGVEPPAGAGDVDLGTGRVAQRRLHRGASPHRVHGLRGAAALGPLDAGRLRGRAALRLLALRAQQPRVRPPHDGGPHAAPAHPRRPRRDPDPPAARRDPVRPAAGGPPRRAVLPLDGAVGHRGRRRRALHHRVGGRRPGHGSGRAAAAGTPRGPGTGHRRGRGRGAVGLAGLVRPGGPGPPLGPRLAQHLEARGIPAFELRDDRLPVADHHLPRAGRVLGTSARLGRLPGLELPGRPGRRRAGLPAGPAALVLRLRLRPVPGLFVAGAPRPVGAGPGLRADPVDRECD